MGDFIECMGECIEENDMFKNIGKLPGLFGARIPKKVPSTAGTKTIFQLKCVRDTLGITIDQANRLGRIFLPITLAQGAYYVGLELYCAGLCLAPEDECNWMKETDWSVPGSTFP